MKLSARQPEKLIAAALCFLLTLFMTVEAGHSHPPSHAFNHSFCVWCFTAHTATVPATAALPRSSDFARESVVPPELRERSLLLIPPEPVRPPPFHKRKERS
jgi:hypothetical protein